MHLNSKLGNIEEINDPDVLWHNIGDSVKSSAEEVLEFVKCQHQDWAGRGTVDMIFALRQIQEKAREQNTDLYMVFVVLTKAFDTVNREVLWKISSKARLTDKMVRLIVSLYKGMMATVISSSSEASSAATGTKRG
ncbi:uncharacterized protein LOC115215111 [Octopus sinensis]|uniref:Uncharacterized protein LOC115215111 n=1 Tax=Octopus sinensis TaxID=2607531 RepID=A0A6P7SP04_9MOLL|nr:uncharacterized protein LOC115215111 [Octopus sinensis]